MADPEGKSTLKCFLYLFSMRLSSLSFGSFALLLTLGLSALGTQGCNPSSGGDDTDGGTDGGVVTDGGTDTDAGPGPDRDGGDVVVDGGGGGNDCPTDPGVVSGICGSLAKNCGSLTLTGPQGQVCTFECGTCADGVACVDNVCADQPPPCLNPTPEQVAGY